MHMGGWWGMWYKVYMRDVGGGVHVHTDVWDFMCPHMHAEAQSWGLESFSISLNSLSQFLSVNRECANSGSFGKPVCSSNPHLHFLYPGMSQLPSLLSFYIGSGGPELQSKHLHIKCCHHWATSQPYFNFFNCFVRDYFWIWMTERMSFKVQVLEATANWRAIRNKNKTSLRSLSKSIESRLTFSKLCRSF